MPHPLETQYDLTAQELLTAIDRRFRLKVALEGAVAEVHFERKLKVATQEGWLARFEEHDVDGMHDFTVVTREGATIRVEVKTVRKLTPTVRKPQLPVVEIQKTRTSNADESSRFYDRDKFDVIAVCMGRWSGTWSEFRYALVPELPEHAKHPGKLAVMHRITDNAVDGPRWFGRFQDVIDALT